jgi:exodeoxyribonuclease III
MPRVKIISWNINGLGCMLKKNIQGLPMKAAEARVQPNVLEALVQQEQPDILCLQEIRCKENTQWTPLKYTYVNYNQTERKGYSGVLVSTNLEPLSVTYGLDGIEEKEGRVITVEFTDFFVMNCYSPNTGLGRMLYRVNTWEPALRRHIQLLQQRKGVILCGDLNVVPTTADMSLTKEIPGASEGERKAFHQLLTETQMTDTFRYFHPKARQYTWGPLWMRLKGRGARLDFFLVTTAWVDAGVVNRSEMLDYRGSDHIPIILELAYMK